MTISLTHCLRLSSALLLAVTPLQSLADGDSLDYRALNEQLRDIARAQGGPAAPAQHDDKNPASAGVTLPDFGEIFHPPSEAARTYRLHIDGSSRFGDGYESRMGGGAGPTRGTGGANGAGSGAGGAGGTGHRGGAGHR